jgi:hypothetical protein
MKKLIVLIAILIVAVASYFNRVRIKDLVVDMQKPDLPSTQKFKVQSSKYKEEEKNLQVELTEELLEIPRHPEQVPLMRDEVKDPVDDKASGVSDGILRYTQDDTVVAVVPSIPAEYNLAVPFQPQAPHANWSLPYKEACEETSLIMVDRFFSNKGLDANEADNAIKKLVIWQQEKFGYYQDTKASEVATIAQEYFGFNAELDYDVTVKNIKQHLSDNKIIIIPVAGRLLGNPYFTGEGPIYHMLVIRGYTKDKFITNDPGTKRGEEFLYSYGTLINAIHDWPLETGGDRQEINQLTMEKGEKVLIVINK